jgi:hypothetical protein
MNTTMTIKSEKTIPVNVVDDQSDTFTVSDSKGREIRYRDIDLIEQYDLSRAMGSEDAINPMLVGIATRAAGVRAIDGAARAFPINAQQVRAAVIALGKHGATAITKELEKREADAETAEQVVNEVKNY